MPVYGNDTIVHSTGDTIHPVEDTDIQMKQENLYISYNEKEDYWDVEVDFIFFNPKEEELKEEIAFVNRAIPYKEHEHRIIDFRTKVNGKEINFKRREEERKSFFPNAITEYFISSLTFPPGHTKVRHTFSYEGTSGQGRFGFYEGFYYTLTTAQNWAGNIDFFSLEVDLPENSLIWLPSSESSITGFEPTNLYLEPYGKYKKTIDEHGKWDRDGMLYLKQGGLFLTKTDYVPEEDLILENYYSFYRASTIKVVDNISLYRLLYRELDESDIVDLSKEKLRLLRNYIFAWYDYKFEDEELLEYFQQYLWYYPEDNPETELTETQQKNVELLLKLEEE